MRIKEILNMKTNALFDKITNSEDEMIACAGIPRRKACTYLRAYIMTSLCFEPYFVISDTSINLNKAFRTLVDYDERDEYMTDDLPPNADFDWLIRTGHIRFAARDTYKGNFSEALQLFERKLKKKVDLPGENYKKKIAEICSDEFIYWYNLDEVSHKFTSNFRRYMDEALYRKTDVLPENQKLVQELIHRLSDEETFSYKDVTAILEDEYGFKEADSRYQYIRGLLRKSYDYNVPNCLRLDYCMPLNNIKPLPKQEWKLELTHEEVLDCNFVCDVYGLAKLPAHELKYIWDSTPGRAWQKQIDNFRAGIFDLNQYVEALNNYLLEINDAVTNNYSRKNVLDYANMKSNLSRLPFKVCHYVKADDTKVVVAKILRDLWNAGRFCTSMDPLIVGDMFFKMLPNLMQKSSKFPEPPSEIQDAIVMQCKTEENDSR